MADNTFYIKDPSSGRSMGPFVGHDNGDGTYSLATSTNPASSGASGALTNRSGTITTGGTAQTAIAANTSRKYVLILNPDTATEDLWFSFDATAVAAAPSIYLHPGDAFEAGPGEFVPTGALSIIAATTAHAFTAKEG